MQIEFKNGCWHGESAAGIFTAHRGDFVLSPKGDSPMALDAARVEFLQAYKAALDSLSLRERCEMEMSLGWIAQRIAADLKPAHAREN